MWSMKVLVLIGFWLNKVCALRSKTEDSYGKLKFQEIASAIVVGGSFGFAVTGLLIVWICYTIRKPNHNPRFEYVCLKQKEQIAREMNANNNNEIPNPELQTAIGEQTQVLNK